MSAKRFTTCPKPLEWLSHTAVKDTINEGRKSWVPWEHWEVTVWTNPAFKCRLCLSAHSSRFSRCSSRPKGKSSTCSWQSGLHPCCNNMSQWSVSPQQSDLDLWHSNTTCLHLAWISTVYVFSQLVHPKHLEFKCLQLKAFQKSVRHWDVV